MFELLDVIAANKIIVKSLCVDVVLIHQCHTGYLFALACLLPSQFTAPDLKTRQPLLTQKLSEITVTSLIAAPYKHKLVYKVF